MSDGEAVKLLADENKYVAQLERIIAKQRANLPLDLAEQAIVETVLLTAGASDTQ